MALTEETIQDKIEVVGEYKYIQVRTATVIKKDGTEISRGFSRHIVTPNISADDLAKESTEVQGIANSVWTDEIKKAYEKKLADETKEIS
jgi:hypothetical protein